MTKRINYADNIFFMNLILKQLTSGLLLSIDAEFFLDKLYDDISFLDSTVGKILRSLKDNEQILNRLEYLKGLERLNQHFIDFLSGVVEGRFSFSNNLEYLFQQLNIMKVNRQQELLEIGSIIRNSQGPLGETNQMVSEEEFKFLLSDVDEEE
ncbi:MAG TPA: hypothetical protein ENI27_07400 [bacterium]|nr:hypothetical protein [bacterium]